MWHLLLDYCWYFNNTNALLPACSICYQQTLLALSSGISMSRPSPATQLQTQSGGGPMLWPHRCRSAVGIYWWAPHPSLVPGGVPGLTNLDTVKVAAEAGTQLGFRVAMTHCPKWRSSGVLLSWWTGELSLKAKLLIYLFFQPSPVVMNCWRWPKEYKLYRIQNESPSRRGFAHRDRMRSCGSGVWSWCCLNNFLLRFSKHVHLGGTADPAADPEHIWFMTTYFT